MNPTVCPVCGGPNACAMERVDGGAAARCWCHAVVMPPQALAAIPPASRRLACLCAACGGASPMARDPA